MFFLKVVYYSYFSFGVKDCQEVIKSFFVNQSKILFDEGAYAEWLADEGVNLEVLMNLGSLKGFSNDALELAIRRLKLLF